MDEYHYHGITKLMAKDFCRNYVATCMEKNIDPYKFRSGSGIGKIMGIPFYKAIDFIVVADKNGYMVRDAYFLPINTNFPTLFKVWKEHI